MRLKYSEKQYDLWNLTQLDKHEKQTVMPLQYWQPRCNHKQPTLVYQTSPEMPRQQCQRLAG